MKLYHGTATKYLPAILREGLQPRNQRRNHNWKHSVPSNASSVYLTSVYAGYFACVAAGKSSSITILEVDTDRLSEDRLQPDEDFLEQAYRGRDDVKGSMAQRTKWYRERVKNYRDIWELSISNMGICSHRGKIPMSAVTKIVSLDLSQRDHWISWNLLDPSISMINYKVCGWKYAAITKWLMRYPVTVSELLGGHSVSYKQAAYIENAYKGDHGFTVVLNSRNGGTEHDVRADGERCEVLPSQQCGAVSPLWSANLLAAQPPDTKDVSDGRDT